MKRLIPAHIHYPRRMQIAYIGRLRSGGRFIEQYRAVFG